MSDPNQPSFKPEVAEGAAGDVGTTAVAHTMTDFVNGKFVEVPAGKPTPMAEFGGYTGTRPSQTPGARYEPGMPVTLTMLTEPKQGDPQVPNLGPGDPRNQQ